MKMLTPPSLCEHLALIRDSLEGRIEDRRVIDQAIGEIRLKYALTREPAPAVCADCGCPRAKAWLDSLPDGSDLPPNTCLVCGYSWPGNTPPSAPCLRGGMHITRAPKSEPAPCPHRELLREAVVHLRYQLAVADPQNDGALAQPCAAPGEAGDLVHEHVVGTEHCHPRLVIAECETINEKGYHDLANIEPGDIVRVYRRRAPEREGSGR